jgi:hypothetical protein
MAINESNGRINNGVIMASNVIMGRWRQYFSSCIESREMANQYET